MIEAGMIQIRPFRHAEHQPNSATIKESHGRRRLKKKLHAQRIAIKSDRAVEIMHLNKDLTDARQRGRDRDMRAPIDFSFRR